MNRTSIFYLDYPSCSFSEQFDLSAISSVTKHWLAASDNEVIVLVEYGAIYAYQIA